MPKKSPRKNKDSTNIAFEIIEKPATIWRKEHFIQPIHEAMATICKHPRVRIVSRHEDTEFVECLECGEVFDSEEFHDMEIEETARNRGRLGRPLRRRPQYNKLLLGAGAAGAPGRPHAATRPMRNAGPRPR